MEKDKDKDKKNEDKNERGDFVLGRLNEIFKHCKEAGLENEKDILELINSYVALGKEENDSLKIVLTETIWQKMFVKKYKKMEAKSKNSKKLREILNLKCLNLAEKKIFFKQSPESFFSRNNSLEHELSTAQQAVKYERDFPRDELSNEQATEQDFARNELSNEQAAEQNLSKNELSNNQDSEQDFVTDELSNTQASEQDFVTDELSNTQASEQDFVTDELSNTQASEQDFVTDELSNTQASEQDFVTVSSDQGFEQDFVTVSNDQASEQDFVTDELSNTQASEQDFVTVSNDQGFEQDFVTVSNDQASEQDFVTVSNDQGFEQDFVTVSNDQASEQDFVTVSNDQAFEQDFVTDELSNDQASEQDFVTDELSNDQASEQDFVTDELSSEQASEQDFPRDELSSEQAADLEQYAPSSFNSISNWLKKFLMLLSLFSMLGFAVLFLFLLPVYKPPTTTKNYLSNNTALALYQTPIIDTLQNLSFQKKCCLDRSSFVLQCKMNQWLYFTQYFYMSPSNIRSENHSLIVWVDSESIIKPRVRKVDSVGMLYELQVCLSDDFFLPSFDFVCEPLPLLAQPQYVNISSMYIDETITFAMHIQTSAHNYTIPLASSVLSYLMYKNVEFHYKVSYFGDSFISDSGMKLLMNSLAMKNFQSKEKLKVISMVSLFKLGASSIVKIVQKWLASLLRCLSFLLRHFLSRHFSNNFWRFAFFFSFLVVPVSGIPESSTPSIDFTLLWIILLVISLILSVILIYLMRKSLTNPNSSSCTETASDTSEAHASYSYEKSLECTDDEESTLLDTDNEIQPHYSPYSSTLSESDDEDNTTPILPAISYQSNSDEEHEEDSQDDGTSAEENSQSNSNKKPQEDSQDVGTSAEENSPSNSNKKPQEDSQDDGTSAEENSQSNSNKKPQEDSQDVGTSAEENSPSNSNKKPQEDSQDVSTSAEYDGGTSELSSSELSAMQTEQANGMKTEHRAESEQAHYKSALSFEEPQEENSNSGLLPSSPKSNDALGTPSHSEADTQWTKNTSSLPLNPASESDDVIIKSPPDDGSENGNEIAPSDSKEEQSSASSDSSSVITTRTESYSTITSVSSNDPQNHTRFLFPAPKRKKCDNIGNVTNIRKHNENVPLPIIPNPSGHSQNTSSPSSQKIYVPLEMNFQPTSVGSIEANSPPSSEMVNVYKVLGKQPLTSTGKHEQVCLKTDLQPHVKKKNQSAKPNHEDLPTWSQSDKNERSEAANLTIKSNEDVSLPNKTEPCQSPVKQSSHQFFLGQSLLGKKEPPDIKKKSSTESRVPPDSKPESKKSNGSIQGTEHESRTACFKRNDSLSNSSATGKPHVRKKPVDERIQAGLDSSHKNQPKPVRMKLFGGSLSSTDPPDPDKVPFKKKPPGNVKCVPNTPSNGHQTSIDPGGGACPNHFTPSIVPPPCLTVANHNYMPLERYNCPGDIKCVPNTPSNGHQTSIDPGGGACPNHFTPSIVPPPCLTVANHNCMPLERYNCPGDIKCVPNTPSNGQCTSIDPGGGARPNHLTASITRPPRHEGVNHSCMPPGCCNCPGLPPHRVVPLSTPIEETRCPLHQTKLLVRKHSFSEFAMFFQRQGERNEGMNDVIPTTNDANDVHCTCTLSVCQETEECGSRVVAIKNVELELFEADDVLLGNNLQADFGHQLNVSTGVSHYLSSRNDTRSFQSVTEPSLVLGEVILQAPTEEVDDHPPQDPLTPPTDVVMVDLGGNALLYGIRPSCHRGSNH